MADCIKIKVENPGSRWAAVELKDPTKVIVEGKTPYCVSKKAEESGKKYMLVFIPEKDVTYIF